MILSSGVCLCAVYKWVGHQVNTDLVTRSHVALLVPTEVRRDAQTFLLRVANPAFLIPQVCQIPAANAVLKLPEVAPKLEILQAGKRNVKEIYCIFFRLEWSVSANLQPGVPQRFAHAEPPPERHLQQVVDETDAWTETDALLKRPQSSAATQWPRGERPSEALQSKTARNRIKPTEAGAQF